MQLSIFAISRLALACASLAVACGGPEVGEITGQEVTLTLKAVASAPEVAALGEADGGLGVSRVVVATSAVRFQACTEGVEDLKLDPRVYELTREPPPSEGITTAVSDFCGLRVEISPWEDPVNSSMLVSATDAEGEPQEFLSQLSTSLTFETDAEHAFGADPLLLAFDVSVWLAGLPAADDESSTELLEAQLRDAATLYVDVNGNGALDDDDRALLSPSPP
jgi:hypothetical protein